MFEIKYSFSVEDSVAPASIVSKSMFLPVKLIFEKDEDSFSMDGGDISVIDFAHRMLHISNALLPEVQARKTFVSAKSGEKIVFEKIEDKLEIIPSFNDGSMNMSFEDFRKGVVQFHRKVILEALRNNQGLKINTLLDQYYSYEAE